MHIEKTIDSTLIGLGYECVDVEMSSNGILRVYIDKPEGVTIDDCVFVSNHLNRILLVEDFDYKTLEVSSPGLDRVIKKGDDFVRFKKCLVTLKVRLPINNQKKFLGRIEDFDLETNCLKLFDEKNNTHFEINLQNIEKARLKPEL